MTESNTIEIYSDILVVLGVAGIIVPALRRFGVSPILSYLGAGAVLGPLGLGSQIEKFPFLYWVTVVNPDSVSGIGELGVVFLLFLIGLKLSIKRLFTMRRLVFGLGGLQVAVTGAALTGIAIALGQPPAAATIIGLSLALSSTAIVLEILAGQGRLTSNVGRLSFAVLLAQDLAVVPIIVLVSILGNGAGDSVLVSIVTALLKASVAIGAIVLFGRFLLAPDVRTGGDGGLHGAVHRRRPVRHHRLGAARPPSRTVHGARRLRHRPDAGGNGLRQGHRGGHRPVQGFVARRVLLHRRHEDRFPRIFT